MQKDPSYYFMHRPPICPYVCSTIKDFQEERNYLSKNIFEQLNDFCYARGTSFKAVNLRWPLEGQPYHVKPFNVAEQLTLSLDYIERSSPFFICILGHTYGEFIPEAHSHCPINSVSISDFSALPNVEQKLVVAANSGYSWLLEGGNRECSITELEIHHAAFSRDVGFQYFYFRDHVFIEEQLHKANEEEKKTILSTFESENDYERTKIWELKIRIVDKGFPVRFFKTKEELGNLVLKDWCNIIERLYPLSATPKNIGHEHSLQHAYNKAFAECLCKDFVPTEQSNKLLTVLDDFVFGAQAEKQSTHSLGSESIDCDVLHNTAARSGAASILVLYGDRGCGKSTIAAKWFNSFRTNNPDITVISYFVGSSGRSSNIMSFMRYCITVLQCEYFGVQAEDLMNNENITDMWAFPLLLEVFLSCITLKPCVLLLDGIDGLSGINGIPAEQAKGFLCLPVNLPDYCKIILTTSPTHLSFKCLKVRSDVVLAEYENVWDENIRLCIFHKHLAMPRRHISQDWLKSIVNRERKMTLLHLALLANELSTISQDGPQYLKGFLKARSAKELLSLIIERWVNDYSWTCKKQCKGKNKSFPVEKCNTGMKGWVVDVLCLLSTSRCGLSEHDILHLLKVLGYQHKYEVTTLHWASFRCITSKWIKEKPDGLLHICHQTFRDVVEHLLLGVFIPINESLIMNPERKQFHEVLIEHFQHLQFSRQVYEEVPWHLKMIGDVHGLSTFISNKRNLGAIFRNTRFGHQIKMDLIYHWQFLSLSGKDPAVECQRMKDSIAEGTKIEFCELVDQCRVLAFAAHCLKHIGKTAEAENVFLLVETQLHLMESEKVVTEVTEILLWAQKHLGDLYREIGSWKEAFCYYQKAYYNFDCLPTENVEDDGILLELKGRLLCNLALLNSSECRGQHNQYLEKALRHFQLIPPKPYEQAELELCQGLHRFYSGGICEAEKHLCKCLAIRSKLYGKKSLLTGEARENLADLQSHLGEKMYSHRLQALEHYKEVIEIKKANRTFLQSVQARQNLELSLSTTFFKLGKLLCCSEFGIDKEGIAFLKQSAAIRTIIKGPDHPLSCEVQSFLKELTTRCPSNKVYFGHDNSEKSQMNSDRAWNSSLPTYPHFRNSQILTSKCSLKETEKRLLLQKEKLQSKSILRNLEKHRYIQSASTSSISTSTGIKHSSYSLTSNLARPTSSCVQSMTGSISSLSYLLPLFRSVSKSGQYSLIHQSAWYHIPGRYPTLHTPLPPKRNQIRKDVQAGWENARQNI
ncbi:putative tetratricopeptide repeat protein 41 isoform X2 [Xenopus tropicalis]|uniref:Tetratricopeptide repeat protein 41 isoform X2 n=1 Tax=Xenopus tropicalis TaxID=8364 RepID=A0A8J1JA27_XENTR|nr:putative tetratricopeptide repeat protein 41 isoform X2 [Xenopus tropicalis]